MLFAECARMQKFVLKNRSGMEIHAIDYGGIITKIITQDRTGNFGNVALGFGHPEDYKHKNVPYFGALIGRFGNRIARGRFTLDGKTYSLAVNNGPNHLHGGITGFDKVFWKAEQNANTLALTYTSKDGEEGYPGNLRVTVTYELTETNELKIRYEAETDKATPANLTQHTYFNLTAEKDQTVLDHEIAIHAEEYTEVDQDLTPTGRLIPVSGTDFDFRKPRKISHGGYDHNFVLTGKSGELKPAATLFDPKSGRFLEVRTTEPGIQFYSGNFLEKKWTGLCLETQHFPDSPNHPEFPSTILRPGNKYTSTTIYKFGVK